jgi:SAM-dependent methyltransferase
MSEAAGADPREGPTLPNETPDPRPAIYRDLHRNQLRRQEEANRHSARVVLAELFRRFVPRSVLDVGCGLGTWLEVARGLGVGNVLGIEGEWLDRDLARLPPEQILALDLEHPFDLGRRFDLVVCLEVAEHLPERAAESFVASLVRHADVVLFSAAIPFQGGRHHVNEQFPEYWARLFARHGCRPLDFLRPALWHDSSVLWYLRQNSLVFAREELATGAGPFAGLALPAAPPALVHPDLYLMKLEHARSVAGEHDKLLAVLTTLSAPAGGRRCGRCCNRASTASAARPGPTWGPNRSSGFAPSPGIAASPSRWRRVGRASAIPAAPSSACAPPAGARWTFLRQPRRTARTPGRSRAARIYCWVPWRNSSAGRSLAARSPRARRRRSDRLSVRGRTFLASGGRQPPVASREQGADAPRSPQEADGL